MRRWGAKPGDHKGRPYKGNIDRGDPCGRPAFVAIRSLQIAEANDQIASSIGQR
jgi:hypothetical protein